LRRPIAWLGRTVRVRARFILALMALVTGIVAEALLPRAWRRSVRMEFLRMLRMSLIGSLPATMFVGALIGFGMVYQAIYWLQLAGQQNLLGTLLISVVLREVAPILVGIILLGRSGSAMLTELGQLQAGGQIRALQAQGVDGFQFLALPRGVAFALASYTLGIAFVLMTLLVGFMMSNLLGIVETSLWSFLDAVLGAASPTDFVIFPIKMLAIGLLVAATACLTAFWAGPDDDIGYLISRGFIRGILAIMVASGLLSLAT
jgi:phospholipid/cholesterol/gamma-HCH transport system permease protein